MRDSGLETRMAEIALGLISATPSASLLNLQITLNTKVQTFVFKSREEVGNWIHCGPLCIWDWEEDQEEAKWWKLQKEKMRLDEAGTLSFAVRKKKKVGSWARPESILAQSSRKSQPRALVVYLSNQGSEAVHHLRLGIRISACLAVSTWTSVITDASVKWAWW